MFLKIIKIELIEESPRLTRLYSVLLHLDTVFDSILQMFFYSNDLMDNARESPRSKYRFAAGKPFNRWKTIDIRHAIVEFL